MDEINYVIARKNNPKNPKIMYEGDSLETAMEKTDFFDGEDYAIYTLTKRKDNSSLVIGRIHKKNKVWEIVSNIKLDGREVLKGLLNILKEQEVS